ncbi:MAG: MFS transporter [Oscillochloridaceae bacterium umkhey_bin13]
MKRAGHQAALPILFLCVFVDMLGYGMIVPLLPFIVREQSDRALLVGLLSSLYALMQLLVAPLLGALSDQIGRRPILIACLLGSALAYSLLALATWLGLLPLIITAIALGGAAGASLPTAQAYIADRTNPDQRAQGLGMVGAAFGFGLMIGPASGGLLSQFGLAVPALVASALALLNAVFATLALPESLPPERRSRHPMRPDGLPAQIAGALATPALRPLLLAIFLLNLAFAGLQSNFPLFSNVRFGWDASANGLFFAFVGLCAILTQGVLIGLLQRWLGEAALVLGGLALMAVGLALAALAPQAWLLYPLVGLMAVGLGLAIPALTSLVTHRTPEGQQGATLGGMQAILSLALIGGPALAGLLFDLAGPQAPYLVGSLLAAGALIAATWGLGPRRIITDHS